MAMLVYRRVICRIEFCVFRKIPLIWMSTSTNPTWKLLALESRSTRKDQRPQCTWQLKMISMATSFSHLLFGLNHKWFDLQKNWNSIHVLVNLLQQTSTLSTRELTWRCWSMAEGTIQCSSNATAKGRKIETSRSADLPDLPRRMPTLLLIMTMDDETINKKVSSYYIQQLTPSNKQSTVDSQKATSSHHL